MTIHFHPSIRYRLARADPMWLPKPPSKPVNDWAARADKRRQFETEAAAAAEDATRLASIEDLLASTWTATPQIDEQQPTPVLDRKALWRLRRKLEGEALGTPSNSMASSQAMRRLRVAYRKAMRIALAPYSDDELRTVTVIHRDWTYTPASLDGVTAAQLKAHFRRHLDRIGLTRMPGPFIAILHGEFEPTRGVYVLHFHGATTRAKAERLRELPNVSKGYVATATGAAPIYRSKVRDRDRQLTYLLKPFWPARSVREVDGVLKRDRGIHRIPEPFGTQVLLWLDRQKLGDIVLLNQCWCPKVGGGAAMKRLYLLVHGRAGRAGLRG